MTSPKSQTIYTDITTIVVLATLRDQAEAAAVAAEPNGGAGTFNPGTPLRAAGDETNAVKAYWCRWNMKTGQRSAFATSLGGPMNTIAPGGRVDPARDRWMFDSSVGWTADEVLTALNFDRLDYGDPGYNF